MQLRDEKQRVAWFDLRRFGKWFDTSDALDALDDDDLAEQGWEPNVSAIRYAPVKVSWTADPPVTPGLYFCKLLGGSTRVVDVYANDRGRLQAGWSDIEEFAVSRPGMLWSDHALQEPE